jgi:hypothetical protein
MEDAKSGYAECELKTGVVLDSGEIEKRVFFREMSGHEEDILASKKMKTSAKMTALMSNCIIKLGDIEDRREIVRFVKKLTITDRWFFLTQLRIESLGPDYYFESVCPQCETKDKMKYNLSKLGVKKAPEANKLFNEKTLPSGLNARFKVADGEVEEKIENSGTDENMATIGLYARISEINNRPVSLKDIKDLPWKDRSALRKFIDEVEGELDDKYTTSCFKCGHEYEAELPLSAESFFFPSVS